MVKNNRKGQATLEYVVLVAGMTAMLIAFFYHGSGGGIFDFYYKNIFSYRRSDMDEMKQRSVVACKQTGKKCVTSGECCSGKCTSGAGTCG